MTPPTLLSQIRSEVIIDVDSMDPNVAALYTSSHQMFCDMTSNQGIVYSEAIRPEQKHMINATLKAAKAESITDVNDVLDILTILLATQVFPYLTGRVHVQTSPAFAYNTEETIAHAQRLVRRFEKHGIRKNRVCIKIPATPESIIACCELEKSGIRTLATCLFSLDQAISASQAGCMSVSPYFNELRVHVDKDTWKEYDHQLNKHPMEAPIASIIQAFKQIDSKTLVKPASIVTAAEVQAIASLKPHHMTLSASVLAQLAAAPAATKTHSSTTTDEGVPAEFPDYLADNAALFRKALQADTETTRKLDDALKIFGDAEENNRVFLKGLM